MHQSTVTCHNVGSIPEHQESQGSMQKQTYVQGEKQTNKKYNEVLHLHYDSVVSFILINTYLCDNIVL